MLSLTGSSTVGTEELEDLSWESTGGNVNNIAPYVTFDANTNTVFFIVQYKDSNFINSASDGAILTSSLKISFENTFIWAYSIDKQRWDLWELSEDDEIGKPFITKNGDVCIAVGNIIYHILGGSNKKLYTWLSKKLTMDVTSIKKVFNKVKVIGPKENLKNYGVFKTESDKIIIATDKGRVDTAKWVQFKIEEMDEEVDSIGIIYRLRAVK